MAGSTRDRGGRRVRPPDARLYALLITVIIVVSVTSHTLIRIFG
jgi:hypothetical protein